VSVFCAIRKAIEAARADAGLKDYFRLDSPATAESIRLACIDDITRHVSVDWLTSKKE
jgi:xanthine dehydrogenase/oxidase